MTNLSDAASVLEIHRKAEATLANIGHIVTVATEECRYPDLGKRRFLDKTG